MDTLGEEWQGEGGDPARKSGGESGEAGSEASQRRRDRRRQPAITSWNVWERVGLDPKGPATTKSPPSRSLVPIGSPINGYSVRPLPCTG